MNTNPTSVNTAAAAAVMAIFLLFATLFGSPSANSTAGPDTGVVSLDLLAPARH